MLVLMLYCRPWTLSVAVKQNSELDMTDDETQLPPKMSILVSAQDNLELTVTKTCLDVLTKLGDVSFLQ